MEEKWIPLSPKKENKLKPKIENRLALIKLSSRNGNTRCSRKINTS